MKLGTFGIAVVVGMIWMQLGSGGSAAATAEVDDAFSRLDELAEEIAERQRALGDAPGVVPVPAPPPGAVPAPAPAPAPAPLDTMPEARVDASCATRQEMAERVTGLRKRYAAHGRAIVGVNDELPAFRAGVLDMGRVCTQRLANDITTARGRVEGLDLEADYRVVETLVVCVDRLREATDDELSATTNNIRMQRLAGEMERLARMTHRVADLERALLRGISKRDRLVQELGQFRQEIDAACQ